MNTFINRKFTTNQFAKMHNINKKTLMYYDDIGLFRPIEVRENGYRYYSFQQNATLTSILLLRKMQVPLKEIKKYINNYTQDMLLDLLKSQDQIIDEKIEELLWLKKIMQNKITDIEENKFTNFNKIEIVKEKKRPILISQNISNMALEDVVPIVSDFIRYCYQNRLYCGYSSGIIVDADKLRQEKTKILKNFYYCADAQVTDNKAFSYIPAGHYLTAYYKGLFLELNDFYKKIFDYAHEHKINCGKHIYEEKMLDDMAAKDFEYVELKISLPVK